MEGHFRKSRPGDARSAAHGRLSHNSGCGISNGCDATYDEANLSPYGIQWWLDKNWPLAHIYVGFSCNTPAVVNDIAYWHFSGANSQFRSRFTSNPPPLLTMPKSPGGVCPVELPNLNWAPLPLSPSAGQTVTFSMHLLNMGGSASGMLMTATLPSHTTYVSGSAATSQGTVSGSDPLVFNLGTVTYNSPLTITFAVLVDPEIVSPTAAIGQTAITWTGGGRSFNYGVIINPLVSYWR